MLTREEIEKVIAELEDRIGDANSAWVIGFYCGAKLAINMLKEVLSNAGERGTEHNLPTEKET